MKPRQVMAFHLPFVTWDLPIDTTAATRALARTTVPRASRIAVPKAKVLRAPLVAPRTDRRPPAIANQSGDWARLLQRIGSGDRDAIAELYDATSGLVFGLALRILGDRALAEDVVVEVYAQVWKRAGAYDAQRGAAVSWLLTLTRSRAIDTLRGRNREQATEPLAAAEDVASTDPDPEASTAAAERGRLVRAALASLTGDQREPIELAYFSGLSHSQIAARLDEPLGTVKTCIRAGMMRLRELLAPGDPFPAGPVTESRVH